MKNTASFSARCMVTPEIACSRILSAKGLKAWWIGSLRILNMDHEWPALHSKMSWRAGGGTFSAQITEDSRPQRVVMKVVTPSADSIITHDFEKTPEGGTIYSKTVEGFFRTPLSRFFARPMIWMLQKFVAKEVIKAAAFAESESMTA